MNTAEESLDEDLVESIRGINNFSNAVIEKHTQYPREPSHEDYKYLVTGAGPLVPSI
jgi:hypothetical protein